MSDLYATKTWSQLGEDSLLAHFFKKDKTGMSSALGISMASLYRKLEKYKSEITNGVVKTIDSKNGDNRLHIWWRHPCYMVGGTASLIVSFTRGFIDYSKFSEEITKHINNFILFVAKYRAALLVNKSYFLKIVYCDYKYTGNIQVLLSFVFFLV